MENEIWKEITVIVSKNGNKFYPDGYEVSNLGRVRSYRSRYGKAAAGVKRPKQQNPTILADTRRDKTGYIQYMIYDANGNRKNIRGHVLVMQTFVGLPDKGMLICHFDDIKHNNALSNLRYGTYSENYDDFVRNKLNITTK